MVLGEGTLHENAVHQHRLRPHLSAHRPTVGSQPSSVPLLRTRKIAVVGLGYAGLPLAVEFGRRQRVVGFDVNVSRISELVSGYDKTGAYSLHELMEGDVVFSTSLEEMRSCDFFIVVVPTPVTARKQPDLIALQSASSAVGKCLKRGDIVVYESTVFPGATEDYCVPILERASGLRNPEDFTVGYSPERINYGDSEHQLTNTVKVISAQNAETLNTIRQVYASIVSAGLCEAASIRVAEAAKVVENIQRDVNIALVNELAVIFHSLGINTRDVLDAASTKWNFAPFLPGLVGGHCISVDPHYLVHRSAEAGFTPRLIPCGRMINDEMPKFIAQETVKAMQAKNLFCDGARVGILGLSFKENCPDLRETRVVDLARELESVGLRVLVHDPLVDRQEALRYCGVQLREWRDLKDLSAVVVAVAHREFAHLSPDILQQIALPGAPLMDIKGLYKPSNMAGTDFFHWQL